MYKWRKLSTKPSAVKDSCGVLTREEQMTRMTVPGVVMVLAASLALSNCQYKLGLCRSHLVQSVYDSSVTLQDLEKEGDYTVLYTSGLKQLQGVQCARMGYTKYRPAPNATDEYSYYTFIETPEKKDFNAYSILELKPGKFDVDSDPNDSTTQFVVYKKDGVLLLYWCKDRGDENFNNNIWVIAVKSKEVNSKATKKAVLEMLYHEDYRHLIDKDSEFNPYSKYLELSPCKSGDSGKPLYLQGKLTPYPIPQ